MDLQRLQGTLDHLPPESGRWAALEQVIRAVMARFGFGEIRSPIIEPTELFARGTGESTDIVQKEMYTFLDRGDRSITLRPEGTPSVVRAYLEESLGAQRPLWKLYYIGPMFRAERPQKGRFRQFHQFGAEMIGAAGPNADIELIALTLAIFRELGLTDTRLVLNSIGSPDARAVHNTDLRAFLHRKPIWDGICNDCKRRADTNPLRVFDCKVERCLEIIAEAPTIDAYLTTEDQEHFARVKQGLIDLGIDFGIDVRMVRGLDYYTRTTFEVKSGALGAQDSICGGGRYDLLVETFDGPPTPAVGFAAGMERVLAALDESGTFPVSEPPLDVFVCALGQRAVATSPNVLARLRDLKLAADGDFLGRGLKAQMKEANRRGARCAILIGDDELDKGQFVLRQMDDSTQSEIPADLNQWDATMFGGRRA